MLGTACRPSSPSCWMVDCLPSAQPSAWVTGRRVCLPRRRVPRCAPSIYPPQAATAHLLPCRPSTGRDTECGVDAGLSAECRNEWQWVAAWLHQAVRDLCGGWRLGCRPGSDAPSGFSLLSAATLASVGAGTAWRGAPAPVITPPSTDWLMRWKTAHSPGLVITPSRPCGARPQPVRNLRGSCKGALCDGVPKNSPG
jgi:hypothetical protein